MRLTNLLLLCVGFFTIANATARAEKTPPPTQKPIETQSEQTTEGETWAEETITRSDRIHPSIYGQPGIFRVRSGYSLPKGSLTFGIGGEFLSVNNATEFAAFGVSAVDTLTESLFVGYAPTESLTLSIMRRNSSTTYSGPSQPTNLVSSLGDFTFGASYAFEVSPLLSIAPVANFTIASDFNALTPSGSTLSAGLGANATFSLYPAIDLPLFLHGNLIYHSSQIRSGAGQVTEKFFGFSRFHSVTLGLGAELHLGDYFIPFLEYHNTLSMGSGLGFFNAPSQITVGTRVTPLENKSLALLVGMDIGTGRAVASGVPYTPPARLVAQLSYTTGLTNSERKHYYTTSDVNVVNRKFIIKKNINFKVASAILEPSSTSLLDQIADVILKNKVKKLLIVGHTDSSANDDYNLKLSLDRANTVKQYLVGKGVAEETLMAQGYGKRKPRASNTTEEGRAKNRRVEFFILE